MGNMKTINDFPFVEPPEKWLRNGKPKILYKNSRWYVEEGTAVWLNHWLSEISGELAGNLIPLQWAPDFIGVSRAALLQRAKNGGLTVISYHIVEPRKSLLGTVKDRDTKKSYDYLIMSECQAWKEILTTRLERRTKGGD